MWMALLVLFGVSSQVAAQNADYRVPRGSRVLAGGPVGLSPVVPNDDWIMLPGFDSTDDVFEIIVDEFGTYYAESYKRGAKSGVDAKGSFGARPGESLTASSSLRGA